MVGGKIMFKSLTKVELKNATKKKEKMGFRLEAIIISTSGSISYTATEY